MQTRKIVALPPEVLGRTLKKKRPKLHMKMPMGPISSKRVDVYKGHKIEIQTTYDIKVDGKKIGGHVQVDSDGRVHSHSLPNYNWPSTVDLVRQVIDSFPDEFPAPKRKRKTATKKRAHRRTRQH